MGLPQVSILRLDIGIKSPANNQVTNVFKFSITSLRVRGKVSSELWGNQFWSSLFIRENKKYVSLHLKVYNNLVWVIWRGLDQWEPFQTSLNHFRQVWTISDKFEPFQTSLNHFRQVWTISDKFEQFQTSLNNLRQVRTILDKFWQSYTNLDKFRQV